MGLNLFFYLRVKYRRWRGVLGFMPRTARSVQPGVALHVVQRGNNRNACFFSDSDRLAYLRLLAESAAEAGCQVHAYCLMTNHVHMLLTPREQGACALMMKRLGQQYVQHVNRIHGRTGTLWEGRFRSSVVASGHYALACHRYIERNPVRARLVERPGDYPWSSFRSNAQGCMDSLLTPHPACLAMGGDRERALAAYRRLVEDHVDSPVEEEIRSATRTGRPIGADRRARGRPKKMGSDPILGKIGSDPIF